ncbi:MAG: polynucleotide adenylyltransferase PcnB [Simkaniaceae bacterium]|nr:polynucleotide adenylyltransferase PcnB [Simkaniaceae bacterium]
MRPQTYVKDRHGIDGGRVDKDALCVLSRLRAAGFLAYLVGGGVRDLLLDEEPKDFDISTSAKPEEIKKLFSSCFLIGRRFRLAHVRFGRKIIEVSTFRAGDTEDETLITEDNIWGTPEQDVLRRDFTVNGLFYDSLREEVIDYVGGYPDIRKKYLRVIGQPEIRFKQDPVRMIRLLKFRARYGFEVDEEAMGALVVCKREIIKSAPPRVLEELLRMLESGSAVPFLELMMEHEILRQITPELWQLLRKEGREIFPYLKEADALRHDPESASPGRPVLVGCLLFPSLEKTVRTLCSGRSKSPYQGEIHREACRLIDEICTPFFRLPKRLRMTVADLLTSQYRIVPPEEKNRKSIRVPRSATFGDALQFFALRARLYPEWQPISEEWNARFAPVLKEVQHHARRKRRGRRTRGSRVRR